MKDKLGIKVSCWACEHLYKCLNTHLCEKFERFLPSHEVLMKRIIELQKQVFTNEEAEKIETFLTHGYQMMINENKEIFSKLEKIKGENNE